MSFTTTNMSLVIPSVLVDVGPTYATLLDAAMVLVDSHNHSTGQGVQITPAGLNISSDLSFVQHNATNLRTARLYPNTSISLGVNDLTCLYALNNELYYVDGAGNNVQVTSAGSLNLGTVSSLTLKDSQFILEYFGDTTKQLRFSAANITSGVTRIFALPEPGITDTLVSNTSTSLLTNKNFTIGNCLFVDASDNTKVISFSASGNTTGKSLVLAAQQSNTETLSFPNIAGADTVAVLGTAQTFSAAKSFTASLNMNAANVINFYNSGGTYYTSLAAGSNSANYAVALPIADGSAGQVLNTNGSGQWGWTTPATTTGNKATATDSGATYTNSSNRIQYISCSSTARTDTLATTSIVAGDTWVFYNYGLYAITLQSSGSNSVAIVPPLGKVTLCAAITTPTTAANWLLIDRMSAWTAYTPTISAGFGTVSQVSFFARLNGNNLQVKGVFASGTVAASLGTITLPFGFALASSLIGYSNSSGSFGAGMGYLTDAAANGNCMIITATGTSTTLMYVAPPTTSASNGVPANGNAIIGSTVQASVAFEVPVTL